MPHGVRGGEARDHDVEVVEGLLRLALRAIRAAVLEEAPGLLVGGLLRGGGQGQGDEGENEKRMARHGYSFRPVTKVGEAPFTSTASSYLAPSGQRKDTVWRPAATGRSRIGG